MATNPYKKEKLNLPISPQESAAVLLNEFTASPIFLNRNFLELSSFVGINGPCRFPRNFNTIPVRSMLIVCKSFNCTSHSQCSFFDLTSMMRLYRGLEKKSVNGCRPKTYVYVNITATSCSGSSKWAIYSSLKYFPVSRFFSQNCPSASRCEYGRTTPSCPMCLVNRTRSSPSASNTVVVLRIPSVTSRIR